VNASEQRPVETVLNSGGAKIGRRWHELDPVRPFAVNSMAADARIHIDFPSADRITLLGRSGKILHTNPTGKSGGHDRDNEAETDVREAHV
jgi:hypothetical protein